MTDPDAVTTSDDEISVGSLVARWQAASANDAAFLSPLVAAARKGATSAGDPDPALQNSFRGRVETFYSKFVDTEAVEESHGHIAFLEDTSDLPEDLEPAANGAVLTPVGRGVLLRSHIGFSVSPELRESEEALRFRAAIRKLAFGERLGVGWSAGTGVDLAWPSRTSWASVMPQVLLDDYLNAYAELVNLARAGTSQDYFWAAFPFSVSVFATQSGKAARAVLLSPLHPLRLAWLSVAERALREGRGTDRLAGVVEAWNLPVVGPQADSHGGRMVAIPIDAGAGQLFLGWSMLVPANVAGHRALHSPSELGALPAPGTSVTGLNADAVRAALRTFQRINPQVSTISIDLASSMPSPRLEEIDAAIVEAIASSGEGVLSPRGGIRVSDSMNRLGDAPLADLERRLGVSPRRPVRWSRYLHNSEGGPAANIRFLQDAGIKVEVSTTTEDGAGCISDIPLKRFVTPVEPRTGSSARELPAVVVGPDSSPYVRALAAMERAEDGIHISAELFRAALVNSSADWTVTGESLVGASALADMLTVDGSGQMLWEWRPPFFETRDTPQLDARPFVSVVKLPEAVKRQMSAHVLKASGSYDDLNGKMDEVMQTLGTRGIGLSSLMAHGGTHAAGAVGFFLTLRLIELCQVRDSELLVLPIDACDGFLRGLAYETAASNQLRRADLLIIAVTEGRVTLAPVEIKCYGLESASPDTTLPHTPKQLEGALTQLESTAELLQQVVESHASLASESASAAAVWRHGFASMIEAAMKLRPGADSGGGLLGSTIRGVLSGNTDVHLGRSLLCYFGHEAFTVEGACCALTLHVEAPGNTSNPMAGIMTCRTQDAFEHVTRESNAVGPTFQRLVDWALAPEPAPSADVSGTTRPSTAGATTEPVLGAKEEAGLHGEAAAVARPSTEARAGVVEDGVRFSMGRTIDAIGSQDFEFWPSNTSLNQMNVGVVGDLGTGKTQFLKAIVHRLRQGAAATQDTPLSLLIFDYKRDYHDLDFLDSVGGQLLRPFHIPLNVLAISGEYTPQKAVQVGGAFVDVITKIYGGIGPVQRSRVLMVIKDLFADKGGVAPTLGEVLDAYLASNAYDSVAAVLNGFVLNEVFSENVDELKTIDELLEDRVLVLAVSDLGSDENLKTALITLFLNKYYEYMLRLEKWPFVGESPKQLRRLNSFVLVDEATNIMRHEFPVLGQLLLQGREFGVGVILASQYLSHFKAGKTNYGEMLLTKVVHKIPTVTSSDLQAFGIPAVTAAMASRVPSLQVHQAMVKTLGVDARFMRGTPFFELSRDAVE